MAFQQLPGRRDVLSIQALLNRMDEPEAGHPSSGRHPLHRTTLQEEYPSSESSPRSDSGSSSSSFGSDDIFTSGSSSSSRTSVSSRQSGGSGSHFVSRPGSGYCEDLVYEADGLAGTAEDPIHVGRFHGGEVDRKILGLSAAMFLTRKLYGNRVSLECHEDFVFTCGTTIVDNMRYLEVQGQHAVLALHYVNRALPDNLFEVFPCLYLDGQCQVRLQVLNADQLAVLMARVFMFCLRMAMEWLDDQAWDLEVWQEVTFMDRPLFNKAARQLEFILGHNLFVNNSDWEIWLRYIHHHLGHPFHVYFPHVVPEFDAILDNLLYRAIQQVSASGPGILSSAVDVHSLVRGEQQERFLLFLTCAFPNPEARGLPHLGLDCPGYHAKLVVGNDVPVMEWDEKLSPLMEELQRDLPPGVEYVEDDDDSRWVEYEAETEATVQVPFCSRGWTPATLGSFQRYGLVVEDEYEEDCHEGDVEDQDDVDMETDELYDDVEDAVVYEVDISRYHSVGHAGYPLVPLSTIPDGDYIPAQFAEDMGISRQLEHLIYGDYRNDGVEEDDEHYNVAVYQVDIEEEDEEYVIDDSPYLPRPIERRPLGELYYRSPHFLT